jgi:gamma-glutamyltranspeptidase/glutathione hydrolase
VGGAVRTVDALAEQGFEISRRLARQLRGDNAIGLRNDAEARAYFFDADGRAKPAGTPLRNPALAALAALLRRAAREGADALHTGTVAHDIVSAVRGHPSNPGLLAVADLAGYRAVLRAPLCFVY